jgi:hypothetical protein
VLADTLRTDRARLRPLVPNSAATAALRAAACRARKDLVIHRVAVANQLRAHPNCVFPGAVGLFAALDSPTSSTFLTRFDCQDRADWLTPTRLGTWLKSVGYTGRTDPATLHARLRAAPRGATGQQGAAYAHITRALVATLTSLVEQIKILSEQIGAQLAAHADAHIFTSLPRSGTVRATRLLSEIGDCRGRFPTPEALICLAGVAPSTRQSGKMRSVGFRWACDKQLRDAICDFANDSRHANPWAADLYNRARARGHDHPHAVRILARAWLYIIWHCWQTNTAYNPNNHRALQALQQPQLDTGLLGGALARTGWCEPLRSSEPPAGVGLACRPVGAWRRHLVKQNQSTRGGPGTGTLSSAVDSRPLGRAARCTPSITDFRTHPSTARVFSVSAATPYWCRCGVRPLPVPG